MKIKHIAATAAFVACSLLTYQKAMANSVDRCYSDFGAYSYNYAYLDCGVLNQQGNCTTQNTSAISYDPKTNQCEISNYCCLDGKKKVVSHKQAFSWVSGTATIHNCSGNLSKDRCT